jgi:serine/threonine protein kinase
VIGMIGKKLGPYQITEKLGEGGMGVVYKAHDTRLARTVALKVLPPGAAADPERRRRFEQEARAVAALNHPHICTLHDIGREGDTDYLVMEFLNGQTLAARLAKGALPRAQALEYAVQIAQALGPAPTVKASSTATSSPAT